MRIGVLHPGAMGSAVGGALVASGHDVGWCSDGRSTASRSRATDHGLEDWGAMETVVAWADAIVSVCPPAHAREVAEKVTAAGFHGTYVDANAIAPATSRTIERLVGEAGGTYVDGSIVGPVPTAERSGRTRLLLSGHDASTVAGWFSTATFEPRIVGDAVGAASAIKMAYAAWTKGTNALLLLVRAMAVAEDVDEQLLGEWSRSHPDLLERTHRVLPRLSSEAWRYAGELEQIARTFEDRQLPAAMALGAAETYQRLAGAAASDDPDEVLSAFLAEGPGTPS